MSPRPVLKVYLAGDIENDEWRRDVIHECRDHAIEFSYPVTGMEYTAMGTYLASVVRPGFAAIDLLKLRQANVIVAYLRPGVNSSYSGTSAEVGYAYARRKHIVVVNELHDDLRFKYAFIAELADQVFDTLVGAITYIQTLAEQASFKINREK